MDRGGLVRYLHVGNDFADRPGDEVFGALDESPDASEKDATVTAEIHISAEESTISSVHSDKSPIISNNSLLTIGASSTPP
jgi:hypothetical protein